MMTKNQRHWILSVSGMIVCATLATAAFAYYHPSPMEKLKRLPVKERIVRDFLKPGVRMDRVVITDKGMLPELYDTRVSARDHVFLLRSPDQLQHLVTIKTPAQALHFARLRTNFSHASGFEIISVDHLNDPDNSDTGRQSPYDTFHSGMYGVLSKRAYKQGGFTPAVVTAVPGGYVIDRWVWRRRLGSAGDRLEHWRETVSPNGAYAETALKSEAIPNLPDTQFSVYMIL